MSNRTSYMSALATLAALVAATEATAGGLHHKHSRPQYLAVPVGTTQVQQQAAPVILSAAPIVQAAPVQMSFVQVPAVQMAAPQTVQMSFVTYQPQAAASAPAPAASTVEVPTFEVKIVRPQAAAGIPSIEPAKAAPQVPSPQAPSSQVAAPRAAQQASFSATEAASEAATAGTSYLIYKLKPHRCHWLCQH